jgi:pimeloyl-ACP methyl ester carboxylesterase
MTRQEPTVATRTVRVPGATLYVEVRGSGPVLLCISGGPTDAGMFTDLAGRLADRYTVVSYDQRGHSRSPLDGEPEDIPVALHADDAAAILAAVGNGPAYVYGNSGGGTVGLELVTRHPSWFARSSRTRRPSPSCCPMRRGGAPGTRTSPRPTARRVSSLRWGSSAPWSKRADRSTARRCSRRRRRPRTRR